MAKRYTEKEVIERLQAQIKEKSLCLCLTVDAALQPNYRKKEALT